jgi:hypothetical protein
MTIPQTLRCLAVAPQGAPSRVLTRARGILLDQLLAKRIYRYVRPDGKAFRIALKKRPKGTKVRAFKDQWVSKHQVRDEDLLPKPGWLRFGFPRSYNSDLLEAMLALVESGFEDRSVLDDPLDQIEQRRGKDGRWRLENSLNGKMLVNVGRKGQASKWITLQAMIVLRHFGRIVCR